MLWVCAALGGSAMGCVPLAHRNKKKLIIIIKTTMENESPKHVLGEFVVMEEEFH